MSEHDNPLRAEKRRKLHALKAAGMDPFPHSFERTALAARIASEFSYLKEGEAATDKVFVLAGRLMTHRAMGKAAFFNLQDGTQQLQCYLRQEEISEADRVFYNHVDIGDFVGVTGFPFRTKKGELSLHAKEFRILCKGLEPLPEKYHGLTDVELKYRHRHLDLIMNEESRKVFAMRSRIIREVRAFLDARGFMEVETPMLQPVYGGAAAFPFTTHHRALDMKLFLKISPELYLKRLIVGGFEKVYDLNRNFRNEGIDRSHNPEFTMLEWYEAYTDYHYQMKQFEDLVSGLVKSVHGTTKITYQGKEMDFTTPWRRLSVYDGVREYAGVDPVKMTAEQLFAECKKHGTDHEKPAAHGEMVMELFELTVEKHLWQPTFIMDHPVEVSPLTKRHRVHKGLVERFEPMAAHMELGNSYTELNDPEDQYERLKEQEARRGFDEEAQPMDEDFVHAIDVGMPPTGGVGFGIDRIVMLLTDQSSIRDVVLFPTMKHKND